MTSHDEEDTEMKPKVHSIVILALVLVVPHLLHAQATSRVIPFNGVATTIAPGSPGQALTPFASAKGAIQVLVALR